MKVLQNILRILESESSSSNSNKRNTKEQRKRMMNTRGCCSCCNRCWNETGYDTFLSSRLEVHIRTIHGTILVLTLGVLYFSPVCKILSIKKNAVKIIGGLSLPRGYKRLEEKRYCTKMNLTNVNFTNRTKRSDLC